MTKARELSELADAVEVDGTGNVDFKSGDISFYEDTGTTPKFFWDASAEKLEVGSIEGGADGLLAVKTNASNHAIAIEEASGAEAYAIGVENDGSLGFYNSGSTTASVIFDDSGKLLSPGGSAFVGTVATGSTNGAIIERGSNSNGEFVKYADGTMICTDEADSSEFLAPSTFSTTVQGIIWYRSEPYFWTFPATFSSSPNFHASPFNGTSGNRVVTPSYREISTSQTQLQLISLEQWTSGGQAIDNLSSVFLSAIGRWF